MPNGNDDHDDDDEFGGVEDSKLVKDLRRQLKEKSKREDELASQLKQLSDRDRSRTLTEALTAKGLSVKAAKFYPADADLTDEAIASWITDNADVFGVKTTTDETPETDPVEGTPPASTQDTPGESVVDPSTAAAYRRMQAASLTGSVSTSRDQDVLRGIAQAGSADELTAFLRSAR